MPDVPPPMFSDRYRLVRHIARGGMAQVYLAQDLLLDRPVALKVLFPELSTDENFVRRFRREAQAAANLSNPNIVSVYDWGQGDRTYFIVMEYVDGQTLSALIRQGPLPAERAAAIGADVAAALEFAHRHNVIHRDVKPGNVLLDASGQVKVTDFGIARATGTSENLTQTGSVMGTATYFSPEQAQGYQVDARSDVYSLGIVLYEMVTGHAPFTGDNPVAIAYKHVREAPVPPRQLNPAVPAAYEAIVLKAMAKSPEDRYPTAGALQADLRRYQAGEPVSALGIGGSDATAVTRMAGAAAGAPTTVVAAAADRTMVAPRSGPPSRDEDLEGSRKGWWIALGVLIALLIAAGVFLLLRHHSSIKTLTVPSVTNQTAAQAQATLTQTGFTNVHKTVAQSSTVQSGYAIGTTPPAGSALKSNAPLDLSVSGGPTLVTVPDVTHETVQAATAKLRGAGFKVTTTAVTSNSVDKGDVVSTNPPPNTQAAQGSSVQLAVSSGKATVLIPSLVGQDPTQAGATLGNLGLATTQLTESSDSVEVGKVTRTSPPAGSPVAVGSTVTVYVSTGSPQVTVPPVVGDTQATAQNALSGAGLVAQVTSQAVTDPNQNGLVQSQSPSAGTAVNKGSAVQLVVGTYTAPSTTTSTAPPSTTSSSTSSTSATSTPSVAGRGSPSRP